MRIVLQITVFVALVVGAYFSVDWLVEEHLRRERAIAIGELRSICHRVATGDSLAEVLTLVSQQGQHLEQVYRDTDQNFVSIMAGSYGCRIEFNELRVSAVVRDPEPLGE
jgi:hypothetical protein